MFAKVINIIKHGRAVSKEFSREDTVDPSEFDDPLAEYVEWTPLGPNGTYAPLQRLRTQGTCRISSRMTFMGGLLLGFFGLPAVFASLVLGVISILLVIALLAGPWGALSVVILIVTAVTSFVTFLLGLAGKVFLSNIAMPIVFDKRGGFFRRGFHVPFLGLLTIWPLQGLKLSLDSIRAVQTLKGRVVGSYELNLALINGERVNLMGCGLAKPIKEDARQLSHFLGIPLWDVIPDWMADKASVLPEDLGLPEISESPISPWLPRESR